MFKWLTAPKEKLLSSDYLMFNLEEKLSRRKMWEFGMEKSRRREISCK